jgi:hypothetical protein
LQIQHESVIHGQDHHRDPTLILILALGTLTWSSMQGSHIGYGSPSQSSRPSPLRNGVAPFSAHRRRLMKELMCGLLRRGFK